MSLTGSTTDGCNIVLAGLDLQPEDEIVTTSEEHFGLLGPLHTSGARVVVAEPDAEAIAAAVTPRTKLLALAGALDERPPAAGPRAARADGSAGARRRRPVGRFDPGRAAGLDFLTISGQKWLCGPDSTGALVVADPERLRVARPSYFSRRTSRPAASSPRRARRGSIPAGSRAVLSGPSPRSSCGRSGHFEHAAGQAARCRELLEPLADVVPGGATLVAFRHEDPPALVARLAEAGVVVREIPKTGLVRVSCGWWTSEDDLQRLAAAVN